jgi:hypothetical protein
MEDFLPSEPNDNILIVSEPDADYIRSGNVSYLLSLIKLFDESADRKTRKEQIHNILNNNKWIEHYCDKKTGRRVLSENKLLQYDHELATAIKLAQVNYDVIFAPKGLFKPEDKKFDISLLKEHVLLKADMKMIMSKSPDTIAKRIKSGCDQAPRIVVDIKSDISNKNLIDGLRSASTKNAILKEIFLLHKNAFYILPKNILLSKRIYDVIK